MYLADPSPHPVMTSWLDVGPASPLWAYLAITGWPRLPSPGLLCSSPWVGLVWWDYDICWWRHCLVPALLSPRLPARFPSRSSPLASLNATGNWMNEGNPASLLLSFMKILTSHRTPFPCPCDIHLIFSWDVNFFPEMNSKIVEILQIFTTVHLFGETLKNYCSISSYCSLK